MGWLTKWWWVFVILAIALIVGWKEKRCQTQAYQCRAAYTAQSQSERITLPLTVDQQASEQEAITAACEPNGYFCRLFSAANLPSVLLLFVGAAGIWAAVKTLKAIEKQADAMVNAERAWLVAELIPICTFYGDGQFHRPSGASSVPLSQDEILAGYHLMHTLKLTNMGRTPATILKYSIGHSYMGEDGRESPNEDIVQGIEVQDFDRIIGGGDFSNVMDVDIKALRDSSIKQVGDSKKILIFHGVFEYQHVFSDVEVTVAKFRYLYVPSTYRLERMSASKPDKKQQNPN